MTYERTEKKIIEWIVGKHKETNHLYDKYLPYEYHLRMVAQVCEDFIGLPEGNWDILHTACWGHDLIEDTRTSYNDCKEVLGGKVADIIYAVTNEKGKNRAERANDKYYQGIREVRGALFVKMCDRIANVQYSKMTKSRMFDMYKTENGLFIKKLYNEDYKPMFDYLHKLLHD